jgi:hypothetical protein
MPLTQRVPESRMSSEWIGASFLDFTLIGDR